MAACGGSSLAVGAHFGASYLVPLDQKSQQALGGLLKRFWPWADGYAGPLGVMTVSSGLPISGFFIAVTSAGLFLIAALAVTEVWVPFSWWRFSAVAGAALSLFLMFMFFGETKVIPITLDLFVFWAAWTNWLPAQ